MIFFKMNKYKRVNVILLSVAILVYLASQLYWQGICMGGNCTSTFLEALRSLLQGSIYIALMSFILIFFDSSYFKNWLFKIFSWGLPLSILLVLGIDSQVSSILSPSRGQAAQFLGAVFTLITVLFIWYCYLREKKHEWKWLIKQIRVIKVFQSSLYE